MLEVLKTARALYADSPSHAPEFTMPEEGTYCMITALDAAATRTEAASPAYRALVSALPRGERLLVTFNANHTTEEVLAVFDKAIKAAS